MPSYTPRKLEAIVEARAQELGNEAYLTNRRHQRLREMCCAARFVTGYSRHFSSCTLEVEPEDEQRDYDFHLHIPEGRLPFQITEVLDESRRRGDEYRTTSTDEAAKLLDQRPWQSDMYASQRVCEELQSKIAKRYAEPETPHMLLYLNLKASSVSWASPAGPAENPARVFASVWLVTQDLPSVDAGTALESVSSSGASRVGNDQGSMRPTVVQGTAEYVTRMSGGVGGRGREVPSCPD